MDTLAKIEQDFQKAYRKRDKEKAAVLSLVKAALKNEEIARKRQKLSGETILAVIRREVKQRKESEAEWQRAGREKEVAREKKAIKILEEYLPRELPESQIRELAKSTIKELKAISPQDLGKVMGALMPKLKGMAEGAMVSKIVQELLSQER